MPLEPSVTWFSDFTTNWPLDGDLLVEGDNHIRNIKTSIVNQFPNFVGAAVSASEAELSILAGATVTTAELNVLDLTTGPGTAEASKALVLDASLDVSGVNIFGATTINATTVNATTFNGALVGNVTGNVTGDLTGNADTATAWNSNRAVTLTGDVTGSSSTSNGTHNIATNIAAQVVNFSNEMNRNGAKSVNAIAASSSEIVPLGYWGLGVTSGTNIHVEIQIAAGVWKRLSPTLDANNCQVVLSDGVNVRVNNGNASGVNINQVKLFD